MKFLHEKPKRKNENSANQIENSNRIKHWFDFVLLSSGFFFDLFLKNVN